MNKSSCIIGLASMITMSAANALSLYDKDGFSYDLKGDWEIQLHQDTGVDQDLDVEFDDLELKNRIEYQVQEGYKFFGQLDYSFNNSANNSNEDGSFLEEAYIGVKIGETSLSIGRRAVATDRFGYEQAREAPGTQEDAFAINGNEGDDVIHLSTTLGIFNIEIATELDADSENTGGESSSDIFVDTTFGPLTIVFGYEVAEEDKLDANNDGYVESTEAIGMGFSYNAGFARFLADYSTIEYELDSTNSTLITSDDNVNNQDRSIVNLAVAFKAAPTTTVTVGTILTEFDNDSSADFDATYANVVYRIPSQENIRLFGEVSSNDLDDTDLGYLVGIRLLF